MSQHGYPGLVRVRHSQVHDAHREPGAQQCWCHAPGGEDHSVEPIGFNQRPFAQKILRQQSRLSKRSLVASAHSKDSVLAQHSAVGRPQRDQPRPPTGPATFPFSP